MTAEKLSSVFLLYKEWIREKGILPCRSEDSPCHLGHLAYMADVSLTEFIPAGRREKAMRWLGYIQGVLVACGWFKLDDVKKHSMPDEEQVMEVV